MPLKLIAPNARSKFYRVRGTHKSVPVDRTTRETSKAPAARKLKEWEAEIDAGELTSRKPITFGHAADAYEAAGGDGRFLFPILERIGSKMAARDITQAFVDLLAVDIYPDATPATRNRQVYTPIAAVLKHNKIDIDLKRPAGAQGQRRTLWLKPEEFEAVALAASGLSRELGILMVLLCYTGMRLGEGLGLLCRDIDLKQATATLHKTKNGDPRAVHLPPRVIAALASHPLKLDRGEERVFGFVDGGSLNRKARKAYELAKVDCGTAPFHCLRHTWATWMVRNGVDLVATGAWRSHNSARGYTHFVTSEEAQKADGLPGAKLKVV